MNLKKLTLCSLATGATFFAALAPSAVMAANIVPTSTAIAYAEVIGWGEFIVEV